MIKSPKLLSIFLLLLLIVLKQCESVKSPSKTGSRMLIVLNDIENDKKTYQKFLSTISDQEYSVTFTTSSQPLVEYGERLFDHIMILSPKTLKFIPKVLLEHITLGGNLLLAASNKLSDPLRDFAFEFGVDFDDKSTSAVDSFNALSDNSLLFQSENYTPYSQALTRPASGMVSSTEMWKPIIFRGIAHRLVGKNPLSFPVLLGNPSTYSFPDNEKGTINPSSPFIGTKVNLVSAVQARNNARVLFAGSIDMFSNEFFEMNSNNDNQRFTTGLKEWVLQEKAALKAKNEKHHRQGETDQHGIYRIKDDMTFTLEIQEWGNSQWNPYVASDVQFEAVMLDPYVRLTMNSTDFGVFSSDFKLPDVYGVFKFRVLYQRHGYSWINVHDTVQVRPYRHDDYPRFLSAAYPYYVNVFSMMAAFLALCAVWLFNKEKAPVPEDKKKN